jgi:hypothetical protein
VIKTKLNTNINWLGFTKIGQEKNLTVWTRNDSASLIRLGTKYTPLGGHPDPSEGTRVPRHRGGNPRKKYYILIFGLYDLIHIRLWTNGCFFANKRWRSLTGSEVILYSTQSSLYRNQLLQVTKRSTGPKLIACLQHTHVTSLIRDLISSRLYKMPRALK